MASKGHHRGERVQPEMRTPRLWAGCSESSAVTSEPGSRKAHGAAGTVPGSGNQEARPAGLLQTWFPDPGAVPKAVLEQPSPRGVPGNSPGRRNIVLSQSDELDPSAPAPREVSYSLASLRGRTTRPTRA